jgi:CRP/FNR family cyclic AMP-dependent transcriptional regulator
MINRFQGPAGAHTLLEALNTQDVVRGDAAAAAELISAGSLAQYEAGDTLVEQGGADNDILFLLAGRVEVLVNGTRIAVRTAGQQVGEMALIDPGAVRAATVRALETTVAMRVSEPSFSAAAQRHPNLWRLLARQLGARLRERNRLVRAKNSLPELFIGCSAEALPIARELQSALSHDHIEAKIWTDGVFGPSRFTIEDLEREVQRADFAALVLTGDDRLVSRDVGHLAPRDNVVFELGLFMGAISRTRTVLVTPRGVDVKIPTDLLGIKPIEYTPTPGDLAAAIGPAANALRTGIADLGTR